MKVGLIARGEERGLGRMTHDFYRHMHPDRTLLIEMGDLARGFPSDRSRYPDATVVTFDGTLPEPTVRGWLHGLDVVYSGETLYDWRLAEWARQAGARTVVHAMPELWPAAHHGVPRPDVVWAPTPWRLDSFDPGVRVVPVPVPSMPQRHRERGDMFLHVAGHAAAADRAGTRALLRALRLVRAPVHVLIVTQDARLPSPNSLPRRVTVERRLSSTVPHTALYESGDVLLSPRRYGGLSLVHNEAAGAGLALVLTDAPPNRDVWPGVYVPARKHGELTTAAGQIDVHDVDHRALAATIDRLAANPAEVADLSSASICWAQAHSWDALRGMYLTELERARQ